MAPSTPRTLPATVLTDRFERVAFTTIRPQVAQLGDPLPEATVRALDYLRALPATARLVSVSETETAALHRVVLWIEHR